MRGLRENQEFERLEMSVKEEFVKLAKECGADLVGVAPAERFAKDDPIFKIFPQAKSVIGIAFRI